MGDPLTDIVEREADLRMQAVGQVLQKRYRPDLSCFRDRKRRLADTNVRAGGLPAVRIMMAGTAVRIAQCFARTGVMVVTTTRPGGPLRRAAVRRRRDLLGVRMVTAATGQHMGCEGEYRQNVGQIYQHDVQ